MAEIVDLREDNPRGAARPVRHDLPAMFRKMADDIEAGDPEGARNAVVVVESEGGAFTVAGYGPEGGDGTRVVGILEWGKHWLLKAALDGAGDA